jgi:phosphate transport system permease protein
MSLADFLTRTVCQGAAVLLIVLVALLLVILVSRAWLSIHTNGWFFFTQNDWNPASNTFGGLAFVWGTLITSALAMLVAVPLGVGSAAFLSEIAPDWLRRPGSFFVEMLAAVPSVVYGFWGMFFLGPGLQRFVSWLGGPNFGGVGIFPAGIILAIMIVPYVTAVSFDVCRAVPSAQREAALSLGATRWQMIRSVVLPYARPGIIGACFIALGRALGETMAVTMLIGNSPTLDPSIFAKGDTIASAIANQFTAATYDVYLSALVQLALVLFLVTILVNALARLLIWRVGRVSTSSGTHSWSAWLWRHRHQRRESASPRHERDPRVSRWVNQVMTWVLGLCLVFTLGPLFLILGYLFYRGIGSLRWEFFVNLPLEEPGGMANALLGSTLLVGAATLVAVPAGLLAAIYLAEYRSRWLGQTVRFLGELLGGVPSIVIGIFAYALIVQGTRSWIGGRPSLFGWAGVFALAVMMVPIVMRTSEEALKLVPQSLRHASYALGAGHAQTLRRAIVPAALPAIITAVFLAIARIVGETAPLLLTAGDNKYWPTSLNDYTPSLPVYIYNYATSGNEDWNRQAWAAALVLLTLVMLLNFGIRFLTGKRLVLASRAD